jgi:ketopantoate reductase
MKILVYGAGPIGSLFSVRLHDAGHDVALLARGQRLHDLREHGVVLEDGYSGKRSVTPLAVVERLEPDDDYDLVLVTMRKNHAVQILPVLAANPNAPTILFLMNNFQGPAELVEALGASRVMLGFPTTGGERDGHVIRVIPQSPVQTRIPLGEPDGSVTDRTRQVASVMSSMDGFGVEIRADMDAWLKYHVALLLPGFGAALCATEVDARRLARTRDALVLAVRATREAFEVLRQAGIPVTPPALRALEWLPEPVLVTMAKHLVVTDTMKISGEGHLRAARDEMQMLMDEFMVFARARGASTPSIDRLHRHYDPATPSMPDGSSEIGMRWGGVVTIAVALIVPSLLASLTSLRRSA